MSPMRTMSHGPARIQRFNGRYLDWTAWFRHFRAVAELQEWDDRMKAVQLVSYLDDLPMNIVQELSDNELYDYSVLVRTLDKRFDPASRVSTYRSKFHGRTRRHQEEAEQFADELNMLCRCGYPHSSPQMRRELICEQFVRGQAEIELQRHLWVVMRTQPERDLQTLIEVCNDFSSMRPTQSLHRPAAPVYAMHDDSVEVLAVEDTTWTGTDKRRDQEQTIMRDQLFALARKMGYEMRPARAPGQQPASGTATCQLPEELVASKVLQLRRHGTHPKYMS